MWSLILLYAFVYKFFSIIIIIFHNKNDPKLPQNSSLIPGKIYFLQRKFEEFYQQTNHPDFLTRVVFYFPRKSLGIKQVRKNGCQARPLILDGSVNQTQITTTCIGGYLFRSCSCLRKYGLKSKYIIHFLTFHFIPLYDLSLFYLVTISPCLCYVETRHLQYMWTTLWCIHLDQTNSNFHLTNRKFGQTFKNFV